MSVETGDLVGHPNINHYGGYQLTISGVKTYRDTVVLKTLDWFLA
jgi:hypothetical protein